MKTLKLLLIIFAPILLFVSCSLGNGSGGNYDHPLQIGNREIKVEIVADEKSRAKGLSGRDELTDDEGMLFDFTNSTNSQPAFWMKDMKFNIDIIWINNTQIIGITEDVATPYNNVNLPTYSPPGDITHVLEVSAGWAERNGISVGDRVTF